ncbi:MAG: homocysteine S-methyltransferase family protein, partial [Solobacterium sp.]|nr:homocysteine S-methyltransferase family protein [Solobacterium sp.]
MNTIRERIGNEWVFFDGGTGSILQKMGLKGGELPERWNLTHPAEIKQLYCGYLEAGVNVFNANTFGANQLHYPDEVEEIITAGIELAKQARLEAGREDACIALDIGPSGKLLEPLGDLSFADAVELFAEEVRAGVKAGADVILIETMSDSYEAKAAVLAAKENSDLPVFITMTFDAEGKLLTGGTVESIVPMLEGLRVDALGMNCSLGPREMIPIIRRFTQCTSLPIIVNPNAGLPETRHGQTIYPVGSDEFAEIMSEIADLGVQGLGGCCGTTPDHIRKLISAVSKKPFKPNSRKHRTVISSYSNAVEFGPKPVIIGERINPTGKKTFQAALRNNDIDYIIAQGLQQEDAGAHVLDVNVGLPDIDEPT